MRSIKFRAWDNKDNKWLLGYEYPNLRGFSMFGECMLFEEWSRILNRFILQQGDRLPEHLILMQFTGLQDKNGTDIYEGDILNVHIFTQELGESLGVREGERECVGRIEHGEFGLVLNADDESMSGYLLLVPGMLHEESFEVIGNIYENPELIIK